MQLKRKKQNATEPIVPWRKEFESGRGGRAREQSCWKGFHGRNPTEE